MLDQSVDKDTKKEEALFRRPVGVLLDEKHWVFLKKRYHMTPRELQVAILVCRGFNNDEIAKALSVRHGTVKTHLRNVYRRVRVKNKILLLLRFVEDVNRYYAESNAAPSLGIVEKPQKTVSPAGDTEKIG